MDVVLHPRFAENHFVYLTYTKRGTGKSVDQSKDCVSSPLRTCVAAAFAGTTPQAIALARGRWNGKALTDVHDLFVADRWAPAPTLGSRVAFGPDGMLYMTIGGASDDWMLSQKTDNDQGKVLRLRDDGTVPPDNPFVGKAGYKPELFTLGHRNILGLAFHPETGQLWSAEMGPQGGDEVDILLPGRNYGWPLMSMGRDYNGTPFAFEGSQPGFEVPTVFWVPAIGISGLTFYTGDKFPKWKDSIFVGAMAYAHLERVVFNKKGQHIRREWMLLDMKQRIRDVRQGPDGCLYLLTDASRGAVLRVEPAE
jgi:glucose/arabinose dehydrogenase